MNIVRFVMLLFLLTCCFACQNDRQSDAKQLLMVKGAKIPVTLDPDFSWPSFDRFWHRGADTKVHINGAVRRGQGYEYDFGYGVNIVVPMRDDMVEGVVLTYAAIAGNDQGGLQFLRLMQHIMRLGGFQWDREKRDALYSFYEVMSPQSKEFYYQRSYFVRTYESAPKLWTFAFYFVNDNANLRTIPPLKP